MKLNRLAAVVILPSDFPTRKRDLAYNVCGHSTMANGYINPGIHSLCTSHNHMHDMRYVQANGDTVVLTDNGLMTTEPFSSAMPYTRPIGVTTHASSFTPVEHSTFWTERSDWKVAMDNGTLWQEPKGSGDPYTFLDFSSPNGPGRVTFR